MNNRMGKTVAAVSTPRGKGGIAVIRISGDEAFRVASGMFRPKFAPAIDWENVDKTLIRRAVYGEIYSSDDEVIDEGILVLYKGPASFTGEDMAEISCHGGAAVTEEVYLSALSHGACSAGPGEFTKRSFLAGKLSLTEAEAVGQLIDADTGEKVRLASGALRGNVSREIERISEGLMGVMSALYAAIDYPEEDVGDEGERNIASVIENSLAKVESLLSTYRLGRAISAGVKTCICGKPNVGKSSLFNLLVGEESAIVTSIAGTTRDVLRENVTCGGVTLRLSDTAGMRSADDEVEKFGIERAENEVKDAELIIAVFDGSGQFDCEDEKIADLVMSCDAPKIAVINKADRGICPETEKKITEKFGSAVCVSAKEGTGGDALGGVISSLYGRGEIDTSRDAVIWDARQREILLHCKSSLRSALDGIYGGDPIDCICTLVEEAMAYLGETDGRSVGEEIVDEVFRRFCVGK